MNLATLFGRKLRNHKERFSQIIGEPCFQQPATVVAERRERAETFLYRKTKMGFFLWLHNQAVGDERQWLAYKS